MKPNLLKFHLSHILNILLTYLVIGMTACYLIMFGLCYIQAQEHKEEEVIFLQRGTIIACPYCKEDVFWTDKDVSWEKFKKDEYKMYKKQGKYEICPICKATLDAVILRQVLIDGKLYYDVRMKEEIAKKEEWNQDTSFDYRSF